MFIFMSFVGLLVPWYTMGKPLSIARAIFSIAASFFLMFPAGGLFGYAMWMLNRRKLNP